MATDGNDLPPESPSLTDGGKPAPTPGAAGRDRHTAGAVATSGRGNSAQVSALADKENSTNEPGKGAQAIAATANALPINRLEDAASANALPISQLEDAAVGCRHACRSRACIIETDGAPLVWRRARRPAGQGGRHLTSHRATERSGPGDRRAPETDGLGSRGSMVLAHKRLMPCRPVRPRPLVKGWSGWTLA